MAGAAGGYNPRPPFVIRLSYASLTNTSLNLDICTFCFGFKSSHYSKILVRCKTQAKVSDLAVYNIFVRQKFAPLSKITDAVIICDLWFVPPPQSKILATRMHTAQS